MMEKNYVFQVLRSNENNEFYWHLKASDHEKVAWSGETYQNLGACLNGLYLFRENVTEALINDRTLNDRGKIAEFEFEVFIDQADEVRWRFQAPNNQIIAVSGEGYTQKQSVYTAIDSLKKNSPEADVNLDIDEPVDVEECANAGHPVPKARRFKIRIDKQRFIIQQTKITGRELLVLAGKSPVERFRIDQKQRGGQTKRIGLDDHVDVCAPGIERFMTMPLDQREGSLRRAFHLPEEDTEFLDDSDSKWETIIHQNKQWLLIQNFSLPVGYTVNSTTIALLISPHYPVAQIDMCYFNPPVIRKDGKVIPATQATMNIEGKSWQRWSRHRSAQNPWRPGIDCIATHLGSVENWLEKAARN